MVHNKLVDRLRQKIRGGVLPGEALCGYTTYETGGAAEILVIPENSMELRLAVLFARNEGIPLTLLGAGSNVIVPDEGVDGITICTKSNRTKLEIRDDGYCYADAGVMLDEMIRVAARKDRGGFHGISGIPGTIGGALVMNAGTDIATISDLVRSVEVLTKTGESGVLSSAECDFGYRSSIFSDSDFIILGAEFKTIPVRGDEEEKVIDVVWQERKRKFPMELPSAGSVFKRPDGDFAGRLIEKAGGKGMRVGGAVISERHANFIVNTGDATSNDIIELIHRVRNRVFSHSGIELELEQVLL
ncbi:MAG: UDP-N-acetylmuramate dehydrogenase [Candidatus Krumholzibacteria bacterium]|nr:UDP-N-acetylmuramate dehydrogenase [Candidatus Krumholzibacteria bacterium]